MEVSDNNDVMTMFAVITAFDFDCSATQFDENWPEDLFTFITMSNGKIMD